MKGETGQGEKSRQGGTQAIQRAALLLRLLARRVPQGSRLGMLAKVSGLPHPTVRRILKCLIEERLVLHDAETRYYRLGPLNFELGLASQHKLDFQNRLHPVIAGIANASGQTTYLYLRSGFEVVCIDRVEGSASNSVATLKVGGRRPLGFSAASLALFADLPDDEIERSLESARQEIESNPRISRESILRGIESARQRGFGMIRDTTILGIGAIGVKVPAIDDIGPLAISVAAINDYWTPARVQQVHEIIRSALRPFEAAPA